MASAELQIPEHIQETQNITREELEMILHTQNPLVTEELRRRAQQTAKAIYGNKIYVRGVESSCALLLLARLPTKAIR